MANQAVKAKKYLDILNKLPHIIVPTETNLHDIALLFGKPYLTHKQYNKITAIINKAENLERDSIEIMRIMGYNMSYHFWNRRYNYHPHDEMWFGHVGEKFKNEMEPKLYKE